MWNDILMVGGIFFGVWAVTWLAQKLLLSNGRRAVDKRVSR